MNLNSQNHSLTVPCYVTRSFKPIAFLLMSLVLVSFGSNAAHAASKPRGNKNMATITAKAHIVRPLSFYKVEDLGFGNIRPCKYKITAYITIDPKNNRRTHEPYKSKCRWYKKRSRNPHHRAEFKMYGPAGTCYQITIPETWAMYYRTGFNNNHYREDDYKLKVTDLRAFSINHGKRSKCGSKQYGVGLFDNRGEDTVYVGGTLIVSPSSFGWYQKWDTGNDPHVTASQSALDQAGAADETESSTGTFEEEALPDNPFLKFQVVDASVVGDVFPDLYTRKPILAGSNSDFRELFDYLDRMALVRNDITDNNDFGFARRTASADVGSSLSRSEKMKKLPFGSTQTMGETEEGEADEIEPMAGVTLYIDVTDN